jgi:hypothetical protein
MFTIATSWNQTKCPSMDRLKIWYVYKMEYYSTIKKNEIILFLGKWKELGRSS